jgi:putative membrane protein insertion efficiency factor
MNMLHYMAKLAVLACSASMLTDACQVCKSLSPSYARTSSLPIAVGMPFEAMMMHSRERRPVFMFELAAAATSLIDEERLRRSVATSFTKAVSEASQDKEDESNSSPNDDTETEKDEPLVSSAMILSIGFYKEFISPLLPPACRFLPTCSQYGVQAIEQFGPTKGAILTAWRLLRCTPFGGKGYDPPRWPPVSYWHSSY